MRKIMIVEDDKELNNGIAFHIRKAGYEPIQAYILKTAAAMYINSRPDLILLGVGLPDGDGFSFCRQIREKEGIPILFITARDLEEDALKGYESGAEDYIIKPFSLRVLTKKIDVILKRNQKRETEGFYDGFLSVDFRQMKVTKQEEDCMVTPTEFKLLRILIENRGQLLTYSLLLDRLWDSNGQFVDKHALAVNINRLRKKIEDEEHKYISNVYGMGYQWLK
nr:response regulator transcription factor [uncultured Anaerostipes sp.]